MCAKPNFDRPIAHRGLHDRGRGIIENTASAFAAAIEGGYAIECDVQLSRDGIPMIFHDDDLDRLTGVSGPVGARTMAELSSYTLLDSAAGDTPQRFDEFLAQIGGRVLLPLVSPPFTTAIGAGAVIKCWDQGLTGVTVGSRVMLTCPADIAYGKQGSPPSIPANATLQFVVDVLGVS